MPERTFRSGDQRRRRRRYLLMLLLLPATGCANPFASLKQQMPWTSTASRQSAETATLAAAKPQIFQTAGYQIQGKEVAAPITDAPGGPIAAEETTIVEPQPIDAADLPTLPAEAETTPDIVGSPAAPQVIDLASALGMAGGNAWTIQLARQKTVEAHADWQKARALWLPTLQLGIGWNKHDGRIQATDGDVSEVSRSSLFLGGGATLGQAPLAGGSGGPIRLFADLGVADAFFLPKIANRQVYARRAGVSVAKNKALLDAGVGYVDLLEALGQVADAQAAITAADELLKLTQTFAQAGAGAQADVDRAATARARLAQQLHNANRLYRTRSANLARRLRLDPRSILQPADQVIVPIELSSDHGDIDSLIGTAMSKRPEINELSQEIAGHCLAVKKANIEPWLPHLAVTTSGGNFGGGNGSSLDNQASRSDVDLLAVWQLESLGLGVAARRNRAGSLLAQRRTAMADLRDQIKANVVAAHEDVMNYRLQIDAANETMKFADASYERNLQRVRADEGLPIELLQAIDARASGLRDRTAAVADYNRAQLRLLYATGQLSQ